MILGSPILRHVFLRIFHHQSHLKLIIYICICDIPIKHSLYGWWTCDFLPGGAWSNKLLNRAFKRCCRGAALECAAVHWMKWSRSKGPEKFQRQRRGLNRNMALPSRDGFKQVPAMFTNHMKVQRNVEREHIYMCVCVQHCSTSQHCFRLQSRLGHSVFQRGLWGCARWDVALLNTPYSSVPNMVSGGCLMLGDGIMCT